MSENKTRFFERSLYVAIIAGRWWQLSHLSSAPIQLGSQLLSIGQGAGLRDQDVDALQYRDKRPAEPLRFD